VSDLTDAELEALITTDISHCQTCQENIVRAIAELRELRAEVGNQSCVAGRSIDTCRHCSYLRRKLADARDENERLRDALKAITSEEGAYMACSDLPWCQASGSGPGSHHAENCAVGIALAALTSVKEAPSV